MWGALTAAIFEPFYDLIAFTYNSHILIQLMTHQRAFIQFIDGEASEYVGSFQRHGIRTLNEFNRDNFNSNKMEMFEFWFQLDTIWYWAGGTGSFLFVHYFFRHKWLILTGWFPSPVFACQLWKVVNTKAAAKVLELNFIILEKKDEQYEY